MTSFFFPRKLTSYMYIKPKQKNDNRSTFSIIKILPHIPYTSSWFKWWLFENRCTIILSSLKCIIWTKQNCPTWFPLYQRSIINLWLKCLHNFVQIVTNSINIKEHIEWGWMLNDLRCKLIVRFVDHVDIGGIVDHHRLIFLFIIQRETILTWAYALLKTTDWLAK